MNKGLITSVSPKECELIAIGKQTMLVRKTRPKIQTPFKCYIYCTKGKSRLISVQKDGDIDYCGEVYHGKTLFIKCPQILWNKKCENIIGKVIGSFMCDKIIEDKRGENADVFSKFALLSLDEQKNYGTNKPLYGWHISDLKIYDKPKELGEFSYSAEHNFTKRTIKESREMGFICHGVYITRPPQSCVYCEPIEEE